MPIIYPWYTHNVRLISPFFFPHQLLWTLTSRIPRETQAEASRSKGGKVPCLTTDQLKMSFQIQDSMDQWLRRNSGLWLSTGCIFFKWGAKERLGAQQHDRSVDFLQWSWLSNSVRRNMRQKPSAGGGNHLSADLHRSLTTSRDTTNN
jgi:hypothetical protein